MFPSSSPATAAAPRFTTAAASLVQTLEHGGNEGKRKQRARVDGYIPWHFCKSVHDIFDGYIRVVVVVKVCHFWHFF